MAQQIRSRSRRGQATPYSVPTYSWPSRPDCGFKAHSVAKNRLVATGRQYDGTDNEYEHSCQSTAANFYFSKLIFYCSSHLFEVNEHLLATDKKGANYYDISMAMWHPSLLKEVKFDQETWVRHVPYQTNLPRLMTKHSVEKALLGVLNVEENQRKCLLGISYYTPQGDRPARTSARAMSKKTDGHMMFVTLSAQNKIVYHDGEGTWHTIHKLSSQYENLFSYQCYVFRRAE